MANPVRIVLFGNSQAEAVQLPALNHIGGNEVVGIAGYGAEKAAATAENWGIGRSTSNWRELLELDPDLVIVTTPVNLHYEMTRAALDAGSAVLCEKPFTVEAQQAEELAELAAGRLALINYQLRWNPNRRKMRARYREGFFGELQHVRADLLLDTANFRDRPYTWWSQAELGGGVMGATGTHMVDCIQWMFGPIEAVSARLETFVTHRVDAEGTEREVASEDYAELSLRLHNGARANVVASLALRGVGRWLFEVTGTEGSMRLDREQHLTGGPHGGPVEPMESDNTWMPPEQYGISGKGPFAALEAPFLCAVVEAVANGNTHVEEAATFADGLANVRVLEAARRSSQAGGGWIGCS